MSKLGGEGGNGGGVGEPGLHALRGREHEGQGGELGWASSELQWARAAGKSGQYSFRILVIISEAVKSHSRISDDEICLFEDPLVVLEGGLEGLGRALGPEVALQA